MSETISSDIIIHLVGEQTSPIYLSAIQFPKTCRHHLVTTEATLKIGNNLVAELKRNGYDVVLHNIGKRDIASDFPALASVFSKLLQKLKNSGAPSISVNITGGTKPMAFTAIICGTRIEQLKSLKYFYLDFAKRELIWLHDFHSQPLENRMTLENFIRLAGTEIKTSSLKVMVTPPELNALSYSIAFTLQRSQETISKSVDHNDKDGFEQAYKMLIQNIKDEAKQQEWKRLFETIFEKEPWISKAKYLAGGWFEDYVYDIVKQNNLQQEIAKNLSIVWSNSKDDAQEFDVCYTDGYSFFILECKAGSIKQDFIQKLENLRANYAGALGICALVTLNSSMIGKNAKAFAQRVQASRSIAAFCGKSGLRKLVDNLFSFNPGKIYEDIITQKTKSKYQAKKRIEREGAQNNAISDR